MTERDVPADAKASLDEMTARISHHNVEVEAGLIPVDSPPDFIKSDWHHPENGPPAWFGPNWNPPTTEGWVVTIGGDDSEDQPTPEALASFAESLFATNNPDEPDPDMLFFPDD